MTNRKTTKKALLGSLLALVLCFAMLVGTTFAWFTDNDVLANNVIKAGTLDIELDKSTVLFSSDSLWEPGYSEPFNTKVQNIGTLWLKYQLTVANLVVTDGAYSPADNDAIANNPDGSNIANVLDVYAGTPVVNGDVTDFSGCTYLGTLADLFDDQTALLSGTLAPASAIGVKDGEIDDLALTVKMKEEAGNEYQNDSVKFDIVVLATQETAEKDGFDNDQYDKDAELAVAVGSEAELAAALGNGQKVVITKDFAVVNTITVTGDAVIDLNGNLDAELNLARPFTLEDGASLTINGGDMTVKVGAYGLVNIPANGDVILNGGNYVGNTDNGAFIKVRDAAADVNVVMNNVKYNDQADDGFVVHSIGENAKITVNGGEFTANAGFAAAGDFSIKNAKVTTAGVAFELMGDAIVDNCDITVDPGNVVSTAPAAFVAVSNGGYAKVTNSTFVGNVEAVYAVYSTGGTIDASNNVEPAGQVVAKAWGTAAAKITVDGDVLVNQ